MSSASGSFAFLGAARFQGFWNAASNNATGSGLTGGITGPVAGLFLTGTSTSNGGYAFATNLTASSGDYWQITGSGTHNVDGNASWNLNDFCIYSGSAGATGDWVKLAFEDTIASIVIGDLSSSSFHLGTENNKHIIFASGSVHSGSNNFVFDYTNSRVGIGTSSPAKILHVNGASGEVELRIQSSDKFSSIVQKDNAELIIQNASAGDIIFYDDSAERLRIKDGGNVGIGTAAPLDTLSVTGTLAVSATTSFRDDVNIADDKKVIFGTNSDAHIEYNEDEDNHLVISGSSSGMVLSGTIVQVSGNMVVKFPNYLAVTSNPSQNASSFYVQTGQGVQFHNGADNGGVTIRDAGDVHIADDKKVIFGTNEDSHIEYNEDGDNFLTISGSHGGGAVISGSKLVFDSSTVASGTIAGPGSYLAVKSTGQVVLTSSAGGGAVSAVANGANNRIATFSSADALNGEANLTFDGADVRLTGSFNFDGGDTRNINFAPRSASPALIKYNQGAAAAEYLTISGSKNGGTVISGSKIIFAPQQQTYGVVFQTGDVVVADDVKLAFGTGTDAHIEYNENGDDFLIISGSSSGMALSGSVIKLDGTIHANAGFDGTHRITGSVSITGSHDVNLKLKSTGSVSIRLEADSGNINEAHNPFIELIQDGGLTDYTIGLTQGSKNPEGATILNMTDNALAFGSNIAVDSTNVGHMQFYNRGTASVSFFDRGSSNHGAADRQGLRVGIGPNFSETNFPAARFEVHNTSASPCPALALTVSGTSQHAALVLAANTTKNIVEITGSALTTGDVMKLYSDSSNTSDRAILRLVNDNSAATGASCLTLQQDALGTPALIFRGGGQITNTTFFDTADNNGRDITTAQLIGGIYSAVNRTTNQHDTTPTAAQIVAAIPEAIVGDTFKFTYYNFSSHAVTLSGSTEVVMGNTQTGSYNVEPGTGREFAFRLARVTSGLEKVSMIPTTDFFNINS